MSSGSRWPYAEAHRKASEAFWSLSPEQQRARMRAAGVVGITPQIGDKVRVLGRLDIWHYAVVVGADPDGRVHVVRNDNGSVTVAPLHEFASGQRVELVRRAPAGREFEAAARALNLRGQRYDLAAFDVDLPAPALPSRPTPSPAPVTLGALLAGIGLEAVAIALSDDREWDEGAGRYRDARSRLAGR